MVHFLGREYGPEGEADDLAQDVLLALWRRRANYDPTRATPGRDPFAYWVRANFWGTLGELRKVRARRRRAHLSRFPYARGPLVVRPLAGSAAFVSTAEPADDAIAAELVRKVNEAVNRLSDRQRLVVVGRMNGAEFAELATSKQAAHCTWKAAVGRLAEDLASLNRA